MPGRYSYLSAVVHLGADHLQRCATGAPVEGPLLSSRAQAVGMAAACAAEAENVNTTGLVFETDEEEENWIRQEAERQLAAITCVAQARSWLSRAASGPPPLPTRSPRQQSDAFDSATPRTESFLEQAAAARLAAPEGLECKGAEEGCPPHSGSTRIEEQVFAILGLATHAAVAGDGASAHRHFQAAATAIRDELKKPSLPERARTTLEAMAESCQERASLF